jgi:hypothetical protein
MFRVIKPAKSGELARNPLKNAILKTKIEKKLLAGR